MKLQNCYLVLSIILFNICSLSFQTQAQDKIDQIIEQRSDSIIYMTSNIPYKILYSKNDKCNFTEREITLIKSSVELLPETYLSINDFYIEKKCVLDLSIDSISEHSLGNDRFHVASTGLGKIILSDMTFSYVKNGNIYQLNEEFSKKLIVHELTHQLDLKMGYSKLAEFRQINSWERHFGFLKYDKEKAEGFKRYQGTYNPREDLATQAEGYFFDADYFCTHPQSYVWFYYWIGPSKVKASACSEEVNSPIDPTKVSDIGYILVSPSKDLAESNFGHSLIRIHMDSKNPYDDYVIQAGGNVRGMPILTGFETLSDLVKKQEYFKKNQPSRPEFLYQGITGQLELKIQPMKFRLKWLETTILEGRDISERILSLTKLQIRALIYTINRDLKNFNGNYNILTKNCASYVASVINKALASNIAEKNNYGIFTPRELYDSFSRVKDRDLPTTEGNASRLARALPLRGKIISKLKMQEMFSSINFGVLESSTDDATKTIEELKTLVMLSKTNKNYLDTESKNELLKLIYSYTVELNIYLQIDATNLYKDLYKAFK